MNLLYGLNHNYREDHCCQDSDQTLIQVSQTYSLVIDISMTVKGFKGLSKKFQRVSAGFQ